MVLNSVNKNTYSFSFGEGDTFPRNLSALMNKSEDSCSHDIQGLFFVTTFVTDEQNKMTSSINGTLSTLEATDSALC